MRLLILSSILFTLAIAPAFAADLAGTWNASVDHENGTHTTPVFTLKPAGGKLTGTFSNPAMGDRPLTGTVDGDSFSFEVSAEVQGVPVKLSYKGKLEGGKLVGTMIRTVNGENIAGKFTATK
jgi:hypothetical protein